jgi:hypothetical protein
VRRAREAGIHWPLVDELDESTLQARLYRREVPLSSRPRPNFAHIHAELSHLGVTRLLLWQEYKTAEPDALYYLRTCDGAEVYFVAEYKGRAIPFEVQWTERPTLSDARHPSTFLKEHPRQAQQAYLVCRCSPPLALADDITALPWFCL